MQSFKGRFEPTRFDDLTVTVDFHCHSACRFCIVQEGMNRYRGLPIARFREVVEDNRRHRKHSRVIFTGGEVTLEPALFDFIDCAKASGTFEHIRVQTNGRRLADRAFAERLVNAGVDEWFVSIHGHDARSQDHISQRPGSFDEALAGLRNLSELGVTLMTNTVLTTLNVAHLERIVETVRPFRPVRMEFWNYLPMEDYADERGLLAPIETLGPALRAALDRCASAGIEAAVKYVPRCVLGAHGDAQDNTQPDVVIVEEFYDVYPKFACIHEASCEHAESCLGLHHPYISKFGWEEDVLVPTPRTTPWQEPEHGLWLGSDQPGAKHTDARLDHPEWRALVLGVAERQNGVLASVQVQRRACVIRFEVEGASVDVVLTARDEASPALVRSASFNVHYRNIQGSANDAIAALVRDAAQTVVERDRGSFRLESRKGLVGPEAFRPRRGARRP
jgi:uncharacterized Fe-S cluster-containing radical SAM superfamily protein